MYSLSLEWLDSSSSSSCSNSSTFGCATSMLGCFGFGFAKSVRGGFGFGCATSVLVCFGLVQQYEVGSVSAVQCRQCLVVLVLVQQYEVGSVSFVQHQ